MSKKQALLFIVLLGLVSLFADVTYEGARSIIGPFMKTLGASAAVLGFAVGFGELIGYAFRLVSGIMSDRTRKYWLFTILGYTINLLAVPLLAFAGSWQLALTLIIAERFGKALRTPARDTLLSFASEEIGAGKSFGIHEALDQIGAISGPLILTFALAYGKSYRFCFFILFVPALAALSFLLTARIVFPTPREFQKRKKIDKSDFGRTYWFYLLIVSMIAFGFADFPLIAYHMKNISVTKDFIVPATYSLAMAVDAVSALIFGYMFDKKGFKALFYATLLAAFFPIFSFSIHFPFIFLGVILWGIGMGAQESIMRAVIARIVGPEKRGSAYGVFFTGYGISWFFGSWIMGFLYDINRLYLILVSFSMQFLASLLLLKLKVKG
ncbi:MFS transporter [Thermotoga sp. KOL6]|uniref:MFS transporter n=1 Tax=Thermotoga sp. KOL6 TaxID=126741 RepID=UPI000C765319|nr:MFS transporter [Thermotoga sp. KOL6]PLV58724.1 MFS transporter [Thermotoga sp. KOL6]